ncbi:septum site determining protein [Nocardioides mesophilus]|uniref:Septum site determining protein n=2 Tax=Nocardioides mesophilus TaxID=433659 RepID=A0A7G9RH92_9ACTN|nr:septum site determining protein [Nocardioides mesophilus]
MSHRPVPSAANRTGPSGPPGPVGIRPLLATCDEELLGDVLRLAAAAGVQLDVAHDPGSAARAWAGAPVVLVGADQAATLGERRPARRDAVHVVGRGPVDDPVFRSALALGAREVLELPDADAWLVELLADAADGGRTVAPTLGVVAGSGGAGASTFAAALALGAARAAPALLLDLDPWGPGLDQLVGFEELPGVRWDGLVGAEGRLGSRSLRAALPQRDGLAVLAWGPAGAGTTSLPTAGVAVEVLSAAQRGSDVVVVDLPRALDQVATETAARCDVVVLVCESSVPSVAAAGKVAAHLRRAHSEIGLVVRTTATSLGPDQVAEALDLPLLAHYPTRRRVAEQVDLGLGPVRSPRSPLARAAREVLAGLLDDSGRRRP